MRWLAPWLLLAGACARPEPPLPPASEPLVDLFDRARPAIETRTIDFGEPEARERLWTGWGPDERAAERTFAWGHGERSSLTFEIVDRRPRRLVLEGWSHRFGDDPPQQVSVRVNGEEIGRRLVPAEPVRLELEVGRDVLVAGENRLELVYGRHARPDAAGLARAVAWDELRLTGAGGDGPDAPPAATPAGDLELPASTALEWTLELPGGSWLAWSGLVARGGARLELAVTGDGERHERTAVFTSGAGRFRLGADGERHRLRRFALRALSQEGRGSLRLEGARLHLPGPEPREPARAAREPASGAAAASRPDLLVYLVGALRADHLGCYGYPRATSPRLDAFARGATRFREGRAQAPWARPAVATLLTGLLPVAHRAEGDADRLPERVVTLAERLAAAGYQTAMVTAEDGVAGRFGFQQGFESFVALRERKRSRAVHARAAEVDRAVAELLERRDRARPLFLVVLVADPAAPYVPEARFRARLAADVRDPSAGTRRGLAGLAGLSAEAARGRASELAALYDAEIAAVDEAFGALLDRLDARALAARTAVFFVGAHGEEFAEHGGWGHGATLFEEQLRVPFLMRLPGGSGAGTVRPGPAEQIDLAPTVLELAGLEVPAALPGRSLLAAAAPGAAASRPPSFAFLGRPGHRSASVVRSQWKLILRAREEALLTRPPVELYALGSDPGEGTDLALERPLHRAWLAGELAAVEARPRAARGGARRPGEPAPERRAQPRGGI